MYINPNLPMQPALKGSAEKGRDRIKERFHLSAAAREELRADRYEVSQNFNCNDGLIRDPVVWGKIPEAKRHNTIGAILEAIADRKPLNRLLNEIAIPTIQAAITEDPSLMVTVLDEAVRELSMPEQFARELLEEHVHGTGGDSGKIPVANADSYIFKPKRDDGLYQEVISGKETAPYTIYDRGVEVRVDRFQDSLFGWSEVDRQMKLLAQGGARSINILIYEMLLNATYGAYPVPIAALQNIGGTSASVIQGINGATATRFGTTGSANKFIYQDVLRAAKHCGERPNARRLVSVVMRSMQWYQAMEWSVSQKIAFQRVRGRDIDLVPTPNFDGTVLPIEFLIDDDLPQTSSLNNIIFCGPPDAVGFFVPHEETSMINLLDARRNENQIPARHSNAAVWWGYSNITVGYNYAIS